MTTLVLAMVNAVLILLLVRALLATGRRLRTPALPHWPESLDLPIPGLSAPPARRLR